jgi:hypothetical protein
MPFEWKLPKVEWRVQINGLILTIYIFTIYNSVSTINVYAIYIDVVCKKSNMIITSELMAITKYII